MARSHRRFLAAPPTLSLAVRRELHVLRLASRLNYTSIHATAVYLQVRLPSAVNYRADRSAMEGVSRTQERFRVQTELGHHVITTGPYRVVRHPMYSGLMLVLPGCALVLGSAWSFAPITMLMATFIVRTVLEDGARWRELPGYKEYCTRTRYRLVPGVW